jgi:FixJ family two-component response regulator
LVQQKEEIMKKPILEEVLADMVQSASQHLENAKLGLARAREVNNRKATQRWRKHEAKGVTLAKQNRDIKRLGIAERRVIEANQHLEQTLAAVGKIRASAARSTEGKAPDLDDSGTPVLACIPSGLLSP